MSKSVEWKEEGNALSVVWVLGTLNAFAVDGNYHLKVQVPFKGEMILTGDCYDIVAHLQEIQDQLVAEWSKPIKIYTVGWGWAGNAAVAAESEFEARSLLSSIDEEYNDSDVLQEHQVQDFTFVCKGDR